MKLSRGNNRTGNNINDVINKAQGPNEDEPIYFYRWVNIDIKDLVRDYGLDLSQINFNRRSCRFMTIFAIVLYPIYAIVSDYVGFMASVRAVCDDRSSPDTIRFVFSICGLSFALDHVLCGCSILVALVGLAYGGEIAFRLAECWVQKYHAVRRIKATLLARMSKQPVALGISKGRKFDDANDVKTNQSFQYSLALAPFHDTWEYPGDEAKKPKIYPPRYI
jgi:hypothetical protein